MYKLSAKYRRAISSDLGAINRLIKMAVMNWPVPNRLKRRAVTVMQYDLVDLEHFDLFVCVRGRDILGVSAVDLNFEPTKGLLHGLFVLPIIRGHGIGRELMKLGFDWAAENQLESVLMKAEGVSVSYFKKLGFEPLQGLGPKDYPHQFEKDLRGSVRLAQAS